MTTFAPATRAVAPVTTPRVRRRALPRTSFWWVGATAAIWATSLFVVALWITGGGARDLLGGAAPLLDSIGRLTGLVASNLLLYQVLLMARVPLFERGFGRDGITRMHRFVGFWSFWLMLGHIVLITVGYALPADDVIGEFVTLVLTYPAMLLALAGTVAVLVVAVLSMRAARRRMRYESWHLLHLYGYIGVGLALPHQLWTGTDFLSSPAATAYWWTLWALTAAAVVVFRILVPVLRNARWGLRVVSVEASAADAVTVTMRPRPGVRVPAASGQFFTFRLPGAAGRLRGTPLSVRATDDGGLRFTARIEGAKTARLARLRRGERIWAEGPYGLLTAAQRTGRKLVMFGAGSGVAPLVAILESAPYAPGEAVLVTRDHVPGGGVMPAAVQRLVDERGVRVYALDGPRAHGASTWLPAAYEGTGGAAMLQHMADDIADADVFLVGPPAWAGALTRDLRAAGVPAARVHTENFTI